MADKIPAIAEIRARLAAATGMPWDYDGEPENLHVFYADKPHMRVCFMTSDGPEANADLIAHAPTDISTLLSHVERLEAALRECAAGYISPPCTINEGFWYTGEEFKRRMEVARSALNGEDAG